MASLLLATALGASAIVATPALAQGTRSYDIPAGPLADVLNAFARQAAVEMAYRAELTAGLSSVGLNGSYGPAEGLSRTLAGTGIIFRQTGPRAFTLERAPQSADGAIQLEPIRVEGEVGSSNVQPLGAAFSSATTEGRRSYAPSVVTIGKTEQALKDIPQSVSVLTRQSMDDQNIITLGQALTAIPGITLARSPGVGSFVYSRGFEISALQYDGVPLARNLYSTGSFMADSMVFYDRIEVLRGAAGLLQGANAPGGAINFVRKRGQAEQTVNVSLLGGSWDHFGGQLDFGGPVDKDGRLRIRAIADFDQADSFVDMVWNKTRSFYLAADYDIDPDTVLGVGISNRRFNGRQFERGLPRYADGGDLGLARSTYLGADWNRVTSDQTMLHLDLEHRFSDSWSAKVSGIHFDESNRSNYQFVSGAISRVTGGGATYSNFATDYKTKGNAIDAYVAGSFDIGGIGSEVIVGGNYLSHKTDDVLARQFNVATISNIGNVNNYRPRRTLADLIATQFSQRSAYAIEQYGVYGTWRLRPVEALTITFGGRLNWYDYSYTSRSGTAASYGAPNAATTRANAKFTPYVGAVYALGEAWSVYASYATIYDPQTSRDADGNLLRPIDGRNYEAGIKGELMEGRANVSLALFRYDHRNRSVNDIAGGFACSGWYCSIASGKVRSEGVEVEANGEILPSLQASMGYTYNKTEYLEDPSLEGAWFSTWTPRHLLRLWADYTLPGKLERISTGLGVTAQSKMKGYDRSFDITGYSVWNARIGYQITPALLAAVNVNNIFDKTYYIPSYAQQANSNFYGDPRNVTVSVKARF
ncbi:TonB-dependent siderophore receptor [Sphingobium sp. SCG-1]|uniref:TonB-dependent siderophore receptor n=1 Tax=Sphingobium sp. SCG-1 TaxID=2072936 RepID=UPI000CD6B87C|nr:TonB-dependent receptor [Sphingobium sp. SCG-1]AUW57582.1 TonB-dependent siderophore receptor [Sphingobium sp. SCG-1]